MIDFDQNFEDKAGTTSFRTVYWYYCGMYGSYHSLFAIQYFMTSETLPCIIYEVRLIYAREEVVQSM